MSNDDKLKLLAAPFDKRLISKKPKPTKEQSACDSKLKIKCKECGGFHHPQVIHLDYVGHAALTDRLLNVDPAWSWEPLAYRDGLPAFDSSGGLWIKLTILGIARIGYGHASLNPHADIGSREKEVIGDALRNAAMRFGCALELWHKGDLYIDESDTAVNAKPEERLSTNYPESEWVKNVPKWHDYVASGKKTAQNVIDHVLTMGSISPDRIALIRSWEKQTEDVPQ